MKKMIILATLAAVSVSAYGASINWTISGINNALDEYVGGVAANTTVYLILADSTSLASITSTTQFDTDFFTALDAITINTTASGADGKKPAVTTGIVSSSELLSAGTAYTFGMIYVSEDAQGNGYFALSTGTATAYNFDPEDASGAQDVALSWSTMNSSSWTQGYAPIPEPSTAALAIAGLAMLIRRRK